MSRPFCRPPDTLAIATNPGLPTTTNRRFFFAPVGLDVEHLKFPIRGGQNLSERYIRLENSLRGKQSLTKLLESIPMPSKNMRVDANEISNDSQRDTLNFFRGFKIPAKPKPPESDECCMSGCAICVYDLYQDSVTAYNESLTSIRSSLSTRRIPESEWPHEVRNSTEDAGIPRSADVTLNAFEELERSLREKRQTGAHAVSAKSL